MFTRLAYPLAFSWILPRVHAQFNLFVDGTQAVSDISQGCTTALNATINCDPYLQQLVSDDYYGSLNNATLQNSVCAASCGISLKSYHNTVASACANDPQPWDGVPAVWAGDVIWAAYNQTCLKDPTTGAYCVDQIASSGDTDQDILALPQTQLCSPCTLALIKVMQSTPFSNYDSSYAQKYAQIQSICNTGPLPTGAQPPATNITALPGVASGNPASSTCLSGNHYTVQAGDDPQAIAVAHGVPTGPLKTLNGIFPDGTNLFAGQDLCLPRTCPIYLVQANDNCAAVASAHGLTFAQLVSYNPSINQDCSNLVSNTNICVGPSGAEYTPTTIPGATSTTSGFAISTVAPPGATPFGTTPECGKFYQVNSGDNCQQISLNNSINVDLFEQINPSINSGCTNLTPGLYYCVWPLSDWNATITTTSTIATPPGPTPSGSTPNCYQWHTIVSGDTCSVLEASFGITMAQLQTWNPQLNNDCTNLLLGEAYCVNGAAPGSSITSTPASSTPTVTPTSTPTSTATGSATPPGPTQAGIASNCDKYVLQQDGIFCFDMANNAGITLDQLYAWNPALNGDCSGLWEGYAYCIGVSSTSAAHRRRHQQRAVEHAAVHY
ncbi:LysM domain-containing protein [Psilocybe cubensis]|uniref:LysM domain-containing protein n=2 Tax=Psilocybe cubensis TaxID=181762 RepID=A0ACB8GSY7_PSICU|nr:LysM domain-containing protein [Psilocybe cubensis]KAH9478590.1 LysM domain-containing protein [Psilocybe cubensis]